MLGAVFVAIYGFAFFPLLETRNPTLIFVAYVCGIALSQASVYGVQSTWFAELFGTRVRYTGASLPYQIADAASARTHGRPALRPPHLLCRTERKSIRLLCRP